MFDAKTATENKMTLDLEDGDSIDRIASKSSLDDIFKARGTYQSMKNEIDSNNKHVLAV